MDPSNSGLGRYLLDWITGHTACVVGSGYEKRRPPRLEPIV